MYHLYLYLLIMYTAYDMLLDLAGLIGYSELVGVNSIWNWSSKPSESNPNIHSAKQIVWIQKMFESNISACHLPTHQILKSHGKTSPIQLLPSVMDRLVDLCPSWSPGAFPASCPGHPKSSHVPILNQKKNSFGGGVIRQKSLQFWLVTGYCKIHRNQPTTCSWESTNHPQLGSIFHISICFKSRDSPVMEVKSHMSSPHTRPGARLSLTKAFKTSVEGHLLHLLIPHD